MCEAAQSCLTLCVRLLSRGSVCVCVCRVVCAKLPVSWGLAVRLSPVASGFLWTPDCSPTRLPCPVSPARMLQWAALQGILGPRDQSASPAPQVGPSPLNKPEQRPWRGAPKQTPLETPAPARVWEQHGLVRERLRRPHLLCLLNLLSLATPPTALSTQKDYPSWSGTLLPPPCCKWK